MTYRIELDSNKTKSSLEMTDNKGQLLCSDTVLYIFLFYFQIKRLKPLEIISSVLPEETVMEALLRTSFLKRQLFIGCTFRSNKSKSHPG